MTLTRYLITLCFLFICSLAFGQTGDTVFMKWKLKPGEVIKYKTLMDEKDSANYVNFSIPSAIDKVFGDSSRSDSTNKMMADFFKQTEGRCVAIKYFEDKDPSPEQKEYAEWKESTPMNTIVKRKNDTL